MSLTVEKCLQAWTNSLRQMNAKADIVFFGDSLTYHGDFSSVFPDKVVCNLGMRGDTIQGMIDRVEQVRLLKPKMIFLMAGINDVAIITVDEFGRLYDTLINSLLTILPDVELIVQSILPVNDSSFSVCCNNQQIALCNGIINRIAEKRNLRYVDLFSQYSVEGLLPKTVTRDGLHLVYNGYERWYNLIKEIYYERNDIARHA